MFEQSHHTPAPQSQQDGEAFKAGAFVILEATRREYVLRGRRALLRALLANGTATADDVRDQVSLPSDIGPKCFGAVPGALAKLGILAADGYKPSTRPKAHGRPIQVWRLADRAKALRWLEEHAEPAPVANSDRSDGCSVQGSLFDLGSPSPTAEGF